jgi:hypothetical protein
VDWTSQLEFEYLIDEGCSKSNGSWAAIASASAYGKTQWSHHPLVTPYRSPLCIELPVARLAMP